MSLNDFDLVLFGATGDLSMRKLLPNLYRAHAASLLHPDGRILGVSRSRLSRDEFLAKVESDARIHLKDDFDAQQWAVFLQRIDYMVVDVNDAAAFHTLAQHVRRDADTIVYLSTAPKFFATACENLAAAGLNGSRVRIVLEKPLGTDLASSQAINHDVARFFREEQIYRIDHYLGKTALQNLLPLRFANPVLSAVWNKDFIRSVQITVAETLGVEERGEFYDGTGALRDMLQNHMLQMLCLAAMERPASLDADAVRDEKLKLLQALQPLNNVAQQVVRGQYTASGSLNGYTEEHNVPADSRTETYVAVSARIDNPRWAGVPFYLRTGKRLAAKTAEIVLNFREQPDNPFGSRAQRLIIRLQPQSALCLSVAVQPDGGNRPAESAEMVLDLGAAAHERHIEAYERLLREVIDGRLALFNRRDELEAAWAWVMPILDYWQQADCPAPHAYPAGSWGPEAARALLAANGDRWLEEQD